LQEVRELYSQPSITLIHSQPHLLNPVASNATKANSQSKPSYNAPATNPKLSKALEKYLAQLNIDLKLNARASIPKAGSSVSSGQWDGSFGLQDGLKKLTLSTGETIEGDYFFIGIGNKYNTEIVKAADEGAVTENGMIWVDEYFKVGKQSRPSPPLRRRYSMSAGVQL
jgi:NADPH-dependent 2,4-dienoyl-CoA reductase/sulfur reductase-like enzyme